MREAKIAVPFETSSADVEVPAKAQRRMFTAEEKKRILEETDQALANGGGVGLRLTQMSSDVQTSEKSSSARTFRIR